MTMMTQAAPNSSGLASQVPARLLPTCGFPRHIRSLIVYVKSPPWRYGNPWWTVRNWREDQEGPQWDRLVTTLRGRSHVLPIALGLSTADRNLDISSGGAFV
ncbi:hypothetical protein BCR44DRAFT_39207 [Catenaria anguillulae PL171]|uniref:Uncharacterized protein n=1 Tax=Catenaria anguillulae PL171 TaxID=765915 RepID=A0A1Y2HL30_9FUNG|nr:hypothetical protein BCR44DRAFT_39207 [Catenaria anguillulae PL171]